LIVWVDFFIGGKRRAVFVYMRSGRECQEIGDSPDMTERGLHIYVGEIPYSEKGSFWVSFESDPNLKRTEPTSTASAYPASSTFILNSRKG
jgi:hypothetical protein